MVCSPPCGENSCVLVQGGGGGRCRGECFRGENRRGGERCHDGCFPGVHFHGCCHGRCHGHCARVHVHVRDVRDQVDAGDESESSP